MAVQRLTYLDLTPEQRALAAQKVRAQIKATSTHSLLTPEQSAHLSKKLAQLDKWEKGTLPIVK